MMKCVVCGIDFFCSRKNKKYCSNSCYEKNRGHYLSCGLCKKEFKGRKNRIYCGMKCAGLSKRDKVIKRNIALKKYPDIHGLSRSQIYKRLNPESTKKYIERELNKRFTVINFLGDKCNHCNYDKDIRALVLDHIKGDGKADRLRLGNRVARYYAHHLEEAKVNLQVLCANCNMIKSFNNKEHNISRRINKDVNYEKESH